MNQSEMDRRLVAFAKRKHSLEAMRCRSARAILRALAVSEREGAAAVCLTLARALESGDVEGVRAAMDSAQGIAA